GRLRLGPGPPGRTAHRPAAAVRPSAADRAGAGGGEAVTTTRTRRRPERITPEGNGWVTLRRPEPALARKTPGELLALAAALPGNLRYLAVPGEGVTLAGELRGVEDE